MPPSTPDRSIDVASRDLGAASLAKLGAWARRLRDPRLRAALIIGTATGFGLLAPPLGVPVLVYQMTIAAQDKGLRVIDLPDGSKMFVNANTQLRVDFGSQQRTIFLDKGQAYLEIAPDNERQLWVRAGCASVQVQGSGFDVRRGRKQLEVSIAHGQASLIPHRNMAALTLTAQERVTYDYSTNTLEETTIALSQVGEWRSGHLSFSNRELSSLIDEWALYRPKAILLIDGSIGSSRVSGTLDLEDPDALLRMLPVNISPADPATSL